MNRKEKRGNMEENRFLLAMMIAKRAKELEKGAKPLVKTKHNRFHMIALEEIKEGKVFVKKEPEIESQKSEEIFEDSIIEE